MRLRKSSNPPPAHCAGVGHGVGRTAGQARWHPLRFAAAAAAAAHVDAVWILRAKRCWYNDTSTACLPHKHQSIISIRGQLMVLL